MGNIFYSLLMEKEPYEHLRTKEAQDEVMAGNRDQLSNELMSSDDPIVVAIRKAIGMCWNQNASDRSSSKEVATFLQTQLYIIVNN